MKGKKHAARKQKAAAILAVVIIAAMLLGVIAPFLSPVYGAPIKAARETKEVSNQNFQMEVTTGYDGQYIAGGTAPFEIILTNLGPDFVGELQVEVNSIEDDQSSYDDSGKEFTIFYEVVDISENATQKFNMDIPLLSVEKTFEVKLVNSKGNVVMSRKINMQALPPTSFIVGILNGRQEAGAMLNSLTLSVWDQEQKTKHYASSKYSLQESTSADSTQYQKSKTLKLTEESFPDKDILFRNFDAIIINDYDTNRLREEQRNGLYEWVRQGGMLILGTGPSATKTATGLQELFSLSGQDTRTLMLDGSGVSGLQGRLTVSDIQAQNSIPIWQEAGTVLLSSSSIGRGQFVLNTFDMTLAPFDTKEGMDYLSKVYSDVAKDTVVFWENGTRNQSSYLVSRVPALKSTGLFAIFGVLFLYAILIGPVLYIVLKLKDKRELGWIIIPAGAVCFTFIIFLLSRTNFYKNGLINIISTVRIENGKDIGSADMIVGLRSPEKNILRFEAEEEIKPIQIENEYNYYNRYRANDKNQIKYKVYTGDKTDLTYFNVTSWNGNQFATNQTVEMEGGLVCKLGLDGKEVVGVIENNTNMDFEDVVVNIGGMLYNLGDVYKGEKIEVKEAFVVEDANSSYYRIVENLFFGLDDTMGIKEYMKEHKFSNEEAFTAMLRCDLLNDMQNRGEFGEVDSVAIVLYAFNEEPFIKGGKKINGKRPVEHNHNIFVMSTTLDSEYMKEYEFTYGMVKPIDIEQTKYLSVDYSSGTIENYGEEESSGVLSYRFPLPGSVKLFQFNLDSIASTLPQPLQIHNMESDQWEELKKEEYDNVKPYMDDFGTVKIRIHTKPGDYLTFPQVRVKGGAN